MSINNIYLLLLIVFCTSCSSNSTDAQITVKSDQYQSESQLPNIVDEKKAYGEDENTVDSMAVVSSRLLTSVNDIKHSLAMYHNVKGHFPNSINEMIDENTILFWPGNMITNEPVKLVDQIETPAIATFGDLNYSFVNADDCFLEFVIFDKRAAKESGNDEWKIFKRDIPQKMSSAELAEHGSELDRIPIVSGKKHISNIENAAVRQLYILTGQLANYLNVQTSRCFKANGVLPGNFNDIGDSSAFLIKESIGKLGELLIALDADFRWGMDSTKETSYTYLKIGEEVFISHCINYSADSYSPNRYKCNIGSLNISNPIISSQNISDFGDNFKYTISANEIN